MVHFGRENSGMKSSIYAVIMAGGGGTRFWPWSREAQPKQMLPIISQKSMIRETVERLLAFIPRDNLFIVTSQSQASGLRKEVPQIPPKNLILEPVGRNTAPCLCLAAMHIAKRDAQAVMAAVPADHDVQDRKGFARTIKAGVRFASKRDFLVTLGVRPDSPETGYGYIQRGARLERIGKIEVFQANAFREKPARPRAESYVRRGDYFWNSGIFIWKAALFLKAAKDLLPDVYRRMKALEPALGTSREEKILQRIYPGMQSVSVDYGILEKADRIAVVEAQFSWSDVGSWAALERIWPRDKNGNVSHPGKTLLAIDSSGCLVRAEKKLIAAVGVKDLVIVEAGNAILVCPKQRSQDVRRVLEELKKRNMREYL